VIKFVCLRLRSIGLKIGRAENFGLGPFLRDSFVKWFANNILTWGSKAKRQAGSSLPAGAEKKSNGLKRVSRCLGRAKVSRLLSYCA